MILNEPIVPKQLKKSSDLVGLGASPTPSKITSRLKQSTTALPKPHHAQYTRIYAYVSTQWVTYKI